MEITINNETKIIDQSNLLSVISSVLGDKTKGIAVAVNQTVIPKTSWETTELKENDKVMIIKATQGG
jgi:sulfur carrier protein